MKWIAFIPAHTLLRSVLHFFPSGGDIAAPYPIGCKLTFFAERTLLKSVALDGLRLSQPDGVRLQDFLPSAQELSTGLIGLEIELSARHRSVNLSSSDCVVEVDCQGYTVRYRARLLEKGEALEDAHASALALNDKQHHSSLVLINSGDEEREVSFFSSEEEEGESLSLAAHQVVEKSFDKEWFGEKGNKVDCSWGEVDCCSVPFQDGALPQGVVGYLMYRDAKTNLPLSVSSL